MKYLTALILVVLFVGNAFGQAPSMLAPSAAKDFVFKIDKENSQIHLFKGEGKENINADFEVSMLELEIFDATGEYAGTLELDAFDLPKEEIADYEKLKIAAIVLTHSKTGEEIIINDVAVLDK